MGGINARKRAAVLDGLLRQRRGGIRCYGHGQYSATDSAHRTPEQTTSPYGGAYRPPPDDPGPALRGLRPRLRPPGAGRSERLPGVARAGSRRLGMSGVRRPSTSSPAPPALTAHVADIAAVVRRRGWRRRDDEEGGLQEPPPRQGGGAGAGRRPGGRRRAK